MKRFLHSICFLFFWWSAGAQTYTIKQGEKISDVLMANDIFIYPQFLQGNVVFNDGTQSSAKLNYNSLSGEIQFIDLKGDTLSLANEETIRYIVIGKDSFYFNNVFVQLLERQGKVGFAERTIFKQFVQKPGSYGLSTETTATNTVNVLVDQRSVNLNVDQEMTLVKQTVFFIANNNNRFVPIDKRNLARVFPNFKSEISSYLSQHAVDLNKREDVYKLITYLGALHK